MNKKSVIGIIALWIFAAIVVCLSIFVTKDKKSEKEVTTEPPTSEVQTTKEYTPQPTGLDAIDVFFNKYTNNYVRGEDTTPPLMLVTNSMTIKVGSSQIPNPSICLDDRDREVKITYEGTYDLNTVGSYKLTRIATDSAGNATRNEFTLKVVEEVPKEEYTKMAPLPLADAISRYKTSDNIAIGIDVSRWQGDIDWAKVKEAGVEFVYMRLGIQEKYHGERYLDKNFVKYFKDAKAAGLQVGVYFYTCATCKEDALEDVKFIYNILTENNYKPDLPIAFDWESWAGITNQKVSLKDLWESYDVFEGAFKAVGFETCLYQSKNYLANGCWTNLDSINVWLAQYYSKPTYEGKFFMWQCSNTGVVPGISGDCDIDVWYK